MFDGYYFVCTGLGVPLITWQHTVQCPLLSIQVSGCRDTHLNSFNEKKLLYLLKVFTWYYNHDCQRSSRARAGRRPSWSRRPDERPCCVPYCPCCCRRSECVGPHGQWSSMVASGGRVPCWSVQPPLQTPTTLNKILHKVQTWQFSTKFASLRINQVHGRIIDTY